MKIRLGFVIFVFTYLFSSYLSNSLKATNSNTKSGLEISQVALSKSSFCPARVPKIEINYYLSEPAEVTMKVFDPDRELVAIIAENTLRKAGQNTGKWDGKDLDGSIVPDEAYFFTIEARNKKENVAVYDPTTFSGGEEFDITSANISRESNTVVYTLPYPARVLIRIGIAGGPLLRTLVDWEPRVAGEVTGYWNGMDEQNIMNVRDHPRFKMVITGYKLTENSVITFGNDKIGYREYKNGLTQRRPAKVDRPVIDRPNVRISSHYHLPRILDYSPKISMSFPETEMEDSAGVPILKDKALVRVEIEEKDKELFINQQYEISFFLDGTYYSEEEIGYSPYNWVWNLANVLEGEHILTANMSSFKDQIGIMSKKIIVVK